MLVMGKTACNLWIIQNTYVQSKQLEHVGEQYFKTITCL